jgi:hypothetical protein
MLVHLELIVSIKKSEPVVVVSLLVEDRAVVDRMVGVITVGEAAASV